MTRRHWPSSAAALALVCAVSGCAVGPDYARPAVVSPQEWRSPREGIGSLADMGWWELFEDPALRDLIAAAIENNRDLQLAVARVAEARAQLGVARAAQFPQIDAGASYTNQRYSQKSFPLNVLPPTSTLEPQTEFYRTNIDLTFELDLWGRLRRATQEVASRLRFRGNLEAPVSTISGGNQQKLVIGKWVLSHADVLIFDEPTRGIDVGSKAEVYRLMHRLAEEDAAVIIVS